MIADWGARFVGSVLPAQTLFFATNETIMLLKIAAHCIVSQLAPSGHVKGVQMRDRAAPGESHAAGASKS